ncbi:MAG: fumarylacetoacetate hydrolase family protein [Rhodobacteraceae bacterium]|nr:fumarylacetoacetate hydrolase family protein [Paracoccaceae bacterium]
MNRPLRLASWHHGSAAEYGLITDNGPLRLSHCFPQWQTLGKVLAQNGIDTLLAAAERGEPIDPEAIRFDIPVPDPGKIICVGVNYPARNEEYADNATAHSRPSIFVRFPGSLTGHEQPIFRPPESEQFDYEGEIALIIGRSGRRIPAAQALNHVAALSLCNEGTIRDWLRHAKFNVTPGKNFDKSGSMGPWMVPFHDQEQLSDIALTTRVNGEVRQADRTGRMLFKPAALIAYISSFTRLRPGDIILTGTPTGAGARLQPPEWLKPGDIVEVEAEGIGVLRNQVKDEPNP